MGRNSTFSKEVKIKACESYKEGSMGFETIAKNIGCSYSTLHKWYAKYTVHGPIVFDISNRNKSYSREFKISMVKAYLAGELSLGDLCAQHNIENSIVRVWINKYNNGIELNSYNPKGDVYTMKLTRKTTFEERLEIVKWVVENNLDYKNGADKFAIPYSVIYQWTQKYLSNGSESLKYKKRGRKAKDETDESSLSEVEILRLKLEREKTLRKRREFEIKVLKKKEEFEKKNLYRK